MLLGCFDSDLENNIENNAWNLEHNVEKLQEILNRIIQRIMSLVLLNAIARSYHMCMWLTLLRALGFRYLLVCIPQTIAWLLLPFIIIILNTGN